MSLWRRILTPKPKGDVFDAARTGDVETARALLKYDRRLAWSKNAKGETPLHWAAGQGHSGVMELLLAGKANVNAKDNIGLTPLHWAADKGHKAVTELLLAGKSDVNAKDRDRDTPLHLAAAKGHKAVMELLLANGADVNSKNDMDYTPLLSATFDHNYPVERDGILASLYGAPPAPDWFDPKAWPATVRTERSVMLPTSLVRENVALLVEAQYYLISDIYNGFLFLSLCIRRENERSELVSGASSQYRDWLGRAPFGFQEWEDPEKRKERAKKAVQLSRPMGVAAMALGIHPELLIVLGKMFHLQVILLSRQNGYDIDTFIKLETDTVYEALWSEVGRSVKAQGGELKSWVDTYFKRELSQETQSAIGSYGADAITLVRLGMKAGDVVEFGRMFCKREPNLLPNYERLSAMARAADIAAPFLKGVDRETMLRFKNDMEGLAESSRREAVREDAIRRGTS